MKFYETFILPKLIHWACSGNDMTRQREKIVPLAKGRVLEVGIGSGLNLPFYDKKNIEQLWGLDPDEELKKMARKEADITSTDIRFIGRTGEQIPLDNNSMNTVLTTYTLCTIPDVRKALGEMMRVLKPGGQLLFCEHGRAPDTSVVQWQNRINPVWKKISGGCNLNRPIPSLIQESGLEIGHLQTEYTSPLKITGFNYLGMALKNG